jgi:hypothetical protein
MRVTGAVHFRRRWALGWVLGVLVFLTPLTAAAQATLRPAHRPLVTAENEPWYLEGKAIANGGITYYPAGAAVFFNPYEMVRTGDYRGIPLYAMKTRAPFDIVFVPVAGGLLQPYERRREGEVAGTVGSSAPSFPVDRDIEAATWDYLPQAAGSPVVREFYPSYGYGVSDTGAEPSVPETRAAEGASPAVRPHGPLTTALRPTGLNAFYIEYQGRRWFSSGPTVLLEPSFTRAGDYHGFPVYVGRDQQPETIYVTVASGVTGLLTPYSTRKQP